MQLGRKERKEALEMLRILAEGIKTVSIGAMQHRIHQLLCSGNITVSELSSLQAEFNGVTDHLDMFKTKIDGMIYPPCNWAGVNKKEDAECK